MASHNYNLPIAKVDRTNSTPFHKTETLDYISKLPNSILIHILTLIPLVDAIRTSLLSKRWNNLWVSIPNLIFKCTKFCCNYCTKDYNFISFVDRILILYNSHTINKFSIDFEFHYFFQENVDSWLQFAVERKTKELILLFYDLSDEASFFRERYNLPTFICQNETFIKLKLSYCSIDSCRWTSLTVLSISCCYISDDIMERILIGCPVLECFELDRCFDYNRIEISSVALKELVVNGYMGLDEEEVKDVGTVMIIAPYIRLLVISGRTFNKKYRVENLSSLVEARLSFEWSGMYPIVGDEYGALSEDEDLGIWDLKTMLMEILGRIKHVKKLTLGFPCLQAISLHNASQLPSIFSNCKNLMLDVNLKNGGLPGLASMLQSCPQLETLTIHLVSPTRVTFHSHFDLTKSFWTEHFYGKDLSCMQHLKMVKIIGLSPDFRQTEVIEFLQYLLKYAEVLEKLSIEKRRNSYANIYDLFAIAQALLRFPRSSPFVDISISKH